MTPRAADRKAVVLVSGGLDSATLLARVLADGHAGYALSFNYGQRHLAELQAATELAEQLGAREHKLVRIDLGGIGGSALTDLSLPLPLAPTDEIPPTYVPARNLLFLSLALGWAEVLQADDIFIGANSVDYSGYPDCRPEFIRAFEAAANLATKRAVEGRPVRIQAPLVNLRKADIVRLGLELGVDFSRTVSCYQADGQGRACGLCDSCRIRRDGFAAAGVADPTRYRPAPPPGP